MEICEKPNLSFFRPVLILGRAGTGKTTLLKHLLDGLAGDKIVFGREREIEGVEYNSKFRRADVFVKGKTLVIEDLPRLLGVKRYERTLMELLTWSRHLGSNVIVTSQTDEGLPKRFLKQFKVVAFFNCALDYKRWWQLVGSKEANYLMKVVDRLPPFTYVLLDLETKAFWNSFRNDEVDKLKKGMEKRLEGKTLPEIAESESAKPENKTRTTTTPPSKKDRIKQMLLEGKTVAEIVRDLKTPSAYVRQVRRDLQFMTEPKTFLLSVEAVSSWLQSLSR
ncbi:MAG: hypothetical protein QW175_05910 [Candidatus Bathyarchaeia archaeon]